MVGGATDRRSATNGLTKPSTCHWTFGLSFAVPLCLFPPHYGWHDGERVAINSLRRVLSGARAVRWVGGVRIPWFIRVPSLDSRCIIIIMIIMTSHRSGLHPSHRQLLKYSWWLTGGMLSHVRVVVSAKGGYFFVLQHTPLCDYIIHLL